MDQAPRVRDAVVVLLQHGCLEAQRSSLEEEEEDAPVVPSAKQSQSSKSSKNGIAIVPSATFSLNMTAVLNRLRIPRALEMAREAYGDVGMWVLENFVLHGRVDLTQVARDVASRLALQHKLALEEKGSSEPIIEERVFEAQAMEVTQRMAGDRFLSPALATDAGRKGASGASASDGQTTNGPAGAILDSVSAGAPTKKGAGKKGSVLSATSSSSTAVAAPDRKRRKVNSGDAAAAAPGADDANALPLEMRLLLNSGSSSSSGGVAVGDEIAARVGTRGRGGAAKGAVGLPDASGLSNKTTGKALWCINWDHISRIQRNKCIIDLVSQRMGALAGTVVRIILRHSLKLEVSACRQTTHSATMTTAEIAAAIAQEIGASSFPLNSLPKLLELMRCDKVSVLTRTAAADAAAGPAGLSYAVNLQDLIKYLKQRTTNSIICERFGDVSGRIFELLSQMRFLDQQRIGDLVIAPSREVRKQMYEMYKYHLLDYVDVSKRGDFNTMSTLFLWYVNAAKAQASLMDCLYKALLNVRVRRDFECEQRRDVMEIVHRDQGVNLDPIVSER